MSHHPEPSGHALHGVVDGLDSEGQHGQRSVAPHSQAAEGGHTPFVQAMCRGRWQTSVILLDSNARLYRKDATTSGNFTTIATLQDDGSERNG